MEDSMEDINVKYLIIGAGISGLTFANYVKEDNYLIVEKDDRVGGYCKTTINGEYVWDYAGHFYHFKTQEMKNLFENLMKNEEIVNQVKNTKIFYKGKYIDYPFQTNIHQLEKDEFIDCLYDLFNRNDKEEYDSFLDMLYGKFGKSIVEKFLKPYNEKLYACDLNNLDKDAMGRFFPYANIEQIINNMKESNNTSYNNTFLYPKKGAEKFIQKLYERLDSKKIRLSTGIKNIDINKKVAYTENGQAIKYEYLINTAPMNKLLTILNGEEDKKLLSQLSYNKVLVFNLGFEKGCERKEHWVYLPEKQYNFYRIGFYNNILGTEKTSMYIEIGYEKDSEICVEEQLKLTLENLKKIGIISDDNKLVAYETIIMNPAYVHVEGETAKNIENYMVKLNNDKIYSIGRYGAWTYCSMEDAMIAAKEL